MKFVYSAELPTGEQEDINPFSILSMHTSVHEAKDAVESATEIPVQWSNVVQFEGTVKDHHQGVEVSSAYGHRTVAGRVRRWPLEDA